MFSNPFNQLFKSRKIVAAEEDRDATVIEEETQAAAKSVEAIMEERMERILRIEGDTKKKAVWDRLNKSRRGRDGGNIS